ncbi:MAG: hypothetical protein ABIM49_07105, partial [candidate division WOR-3 bacterium]
AGGIFAGINAFLRKKGKETLIFPKNTAIGALINYITSSNNQNFSPMNINLGLFEDIPKFKDKREKRKFIAERAISELKKFIDENSWLFKGEVKDA